MSEPAVTPEALREAIERARLRYANYSGAPMPVAQVERNAHLDTLQAILDLHKPDEVFDRGRCAHDEYKWPCPDVQTVADDLRRMGALT